MSGLSYRVLLAVVGAANLILIAVAATADVTTAPASPGARQTPVEAKRELLVAHDLMRNEPIIAADTSQLQLLFPDQSSLTMARGAEISIDEFRYDPRARSGNLAATLREGLVRYVGGKIAVDKGVTFASPGGVVSSRGGIVLINAHNDAQGARTEAILLSRGRMCLAAGGQRRCTDKIDTALAGVRGQALAAASAVGEQKIQRWFSRLEGVSRYQPQGADAVR